MRKVKYKVPAGVKLEILDDTAYRKDRQDSAFYTYGDSSTVAIITYGDRELRVLCLGEMRLIYGDRTIYDVEDLISAGITNDKKLGKVSDKGGEWVNNSWFEIYDVNLGDTDFSVYHEARDAINTALMDIMQEREEVDA